MQGIKLRGIACQQKDKLLITGSISAKELIQIYEVDQWQRGRSVDTQGCQRPPIKSHYMRLARQLKDDTRTVLPTSITLSATEYNEENDATQNHNTVVLTKMKNEIIEILIPKGNKLKIVDGQHRVLGLKHAVQELNYKGVENFEIPFVLAIVGSRLEEIKMFYDINTKGKKVRTDLALQLLNQWSTHNISKLQKGEIWRLVGLNVAMALNDDPKSIWYKAIEMANEDREGTIPSSSFTTSLYPVLHDISFIRSIWQNTEDYANAGIMIAKLVNNFWNALAVVVPECFPKDMHEKQNWLVQKFVGANVWHLAMPFIIEELMYNRLKIEDLTTDNIANVVKQFGGYGVDDATVVWEAPNAAEGIEGGDASDASARAAYKSLAKQITDDVQQNYIGTGRAAANF
jgi:DGQHR domain-containing protein